MKGKVLGFDAASGTGAITGEDGKRYSFATADIKGGSSALKPNDSVDFEAEGSAAKDIWPVVAGGFAMPKFNTPGGDSSASPSAAGGDIVQMVLARPIVIWAALVILGALIAGYLNAFSMMQFGGMAFLFILLFLLPVAAGGLIYVELTNHALKNQARLATGAAAIALPILVPVIVGSGGMGGLFSAFGAASDWFGFGITLPKILMVGGGVLIILTHLGYIKKLG